jgi:HlyD family secretion protein
VTKGGQVAKLLGFDISEAQLRQAETETEVQARLLDQVRAGEKAGTIAAQEATVLRLEAEMENAAIVLKRDQELFKQKTLSQNDFDRSELALRVARKNHEQAVNQLSSLKEIRAVDIRVAEARLKAATETARRIRVELEQTIIRSPIDGVVLEVRTYPGERLEKDPLVELGELDKMRVEAEVYVTDITLVRMGARAKVSGDGITGELAGAVSEIGLQVDRSSVFNPDPASFNDKRVVKVWITLEDSSQVRGLANHQVQVRIAP